MYGLLLVVWLLWMTQPHDPMSKLGFDHIYVLNLENRTDRRERMTRLGNTLGIDLEFFKATSIADIVDPKYTFVNQNGKKHAEMGIGFTPYKSANLGINGPGELACWQSHLRLWLDILDKGYETALIFEDDIDLDVDIKAIMADVHESMAYSGMGWDMFYLGHCMMFMGQRITNKTPATLRPFSMPRTGLHALRGSDRIHTLPGTYCLHAYALSAKGARMLVDHHSNAISQPIDNAMLGHLSKFRAYTLHPPPVDQIPKTADNPSNIRARDRALDYFHELPYGAYHMIDELRPYRIGKLVQLETVEGERLCFNEFLTTGCADPSSYVFRMLNILYQQIVIKTPHGHLKVEPTKQMAHAPHIMDWEVFHVTDDGRVLSHHHTCFGLNGDRVVVSPQCEHFDIQNDGGQFTMRTSQGTYVYVHTDGFLRHSPTKTTINLIIRSAKAVTFALQTVEYMASDHGDRIGKLTHLYDHSRFDIHPYDGYVEFKSTKGFLRLKDGYVTFSPEPGRFIIVPL
jgi:GR25 family glycosyltransferase involved in LPS biosynthesis